MRETVYRCHAPDCQVYMHSTTPAPARGWLLVHEHDTDGQTRDLDFCSLDCVLKVAAGIEPSTLIPL